MYERLIKRQKVLSVADLVFINEEISLSLRKHKEIREEARVCVFCASFKLILTVTVVPQESRLKLNKALALSVSMGTQLGSNRVVRLG